MRKIQKILLGSFLTGVLICGVGAGTAIGEYSSLTLSLIHISEPTRH